MKNVFSGDNIDNLTHMMNEDSLQYLRANLGGNFISSEAKNQFLELQQNVGVGYLNSLNIGQVLSQETNPRLTFNPAYLSQSSGGQVAMYLFAKTPEEIVYDTRKNVWNPSIHKNTWPVTIDTIFMATEFKKRLNNTGKLEEALDLGCGTGFLGNFLVEGNYVNHVTLTDINPHAVNSTRENLSHLRKSKYSNFISDGYEGVSNRYDLIVVNPPYIPEKPTSELIETAENVYNGIDLLIKSIDQAGDYLYDKGNLMVNYSSVAQKESEIAIKKSGLTIEGTSKLSVPFRIPNVLENQKWMEELQSKGRIQYAPKGGYDFWHDLNFVHLMKK
jgi:tRNA1(Val) A37 N6-methylase TrmN6